MIKSLSKRVTMTLKCTKRLYFITKLSKHNQRIGWASSYRVVLYFFSTAEMHNLLSFAQATTSHNVCLLFCLVSIANVFFPLNYI